MKKELENAPPEPREPAAREGQSIEAFWSQWCHDNAIEAAEGWLELTPKQARDFALAYSAELRANLTEKEAEYENLRKAFYRMADAKERSLLQARLVIEAARCIRHWHDSGRNNEGMIVSSEHVRKLWEALGKYDEFLASTSPQGGLGKS